MQATGQITALLREVNAGDPEAMTRLVERVYGELRNLARIQMKREPSGHTLQATALVHETYVRLLATENPNWSNRAHFFGAAAEAMRRVLVDHARARKSKKRNPESFGPPDFPALSTGREVDYLALDEALTSLERFDERRCRIVKLRFFAGCSIEEIAALLGVSDRTVKRDWNFARAWLQRELDCMKDGAR